jgi:glycosyltransferase involved in cell wall biosynthesis
LLPPGARLPEVPAVSAAARGILYVGAMANAASGGDLLVEALHRARERSQDLRLLCVAPPGQGPREPYPSWIEVIRASGTEIERLLPQVLATIVPRLHTPYNDLAVPIKVFEYLGYGRPLIVTDAVETAAIVRATGCGVVVPATAEGLAAGISEVASASPAVVARWGEAAREAAAANSWESRAGRVLELLHVSG